MPTSSQSKNMLKWKKGLHGRPETTDGRFYVDGHWDQKPGYYELVDTHRNKRHQAARLRDLKSDAQAIVDREALRRSGLYDNHMNP